MGQNKQNKQNKQSINEKRGQQTMDVWNSVIFGAMWRCFLVCIAIEIIFAITYCYMGDILWQDYFVDFLMKPFILQGLVLMITKVIFYFSKEHLNDFALDIVGILSSNLLVLIMVWTFSSEPCIGFVLLMPIMLVSVYKRKELIKVQMVITFAIFVMYRLWFLPNSKYMLQDEVWGDIFIFIGVAVMFAFVEEQVRKSSAQVDIQVWKDSLTNLYNHEAFYEELESWMKQFETEKEPFCILVADIDNFKKVNDTYGHAYGDEVIRIISRVMEKNRGSKDFVARYGGEEFAMIMPSRQVKEAVLMADKIRKEFAAQRFETEDGEKSFTISIGVAEYNQPYRTSSAFFEEADKALYQAKASGKNKVCCLSKSNLN